jgi:uncharacterized metal-binding protein
MAGCSCGEGCEKRLVYACSGAANTGLLADQVMRSLDREGQAEASCLAALGAGLSGFIETARSAGGAVVIDGCRVGCGAKIFEGRGLAFTHFVMTDFEVEKGKTAITEELVEAVTERIAGQLARGL